ncbi:MAG: TVP38/TMEM64 family protein [Nitrospirota bacterium]
MARWLKLVLLIIVVGGSLALGWQIDFEQVLNPAHIAELLQSFGPWGPPVLIVSMATAVVIPPIPSLPLDLASGAAFGPLFGTIYAVIGAAIGAMLSFLIGRALGREGISRLLGVDAVFCEKCSDHHIGLLIFLARLLPIVSFDVVSYGAGFTTVSLRAFSLATIAGMIPPTFAFVYLGSSVISAQWLLIGLSLLLVALFVLLPKWLKRNRSSKLAQFMFGSAPTAVEPVASTTASTTCPACGGTVMPLILPTKPGRPTPAGLPPYRATIG